MIIVREATIDDAEEIASIGKQSYSWAFAYLFPQDVLSRYLQRTYSQEKIAGSLCKSNNLYFVAQASGQTLGFLKFKRDCPHPEIIAPRQWQLQKMYVQPDHISRGVGQALMQAGEQRVGREKIDVVWLLVHVDNSRAISFYEKFHYNIFTHGVVYFEHIRIDFNVMKKCFRS